jgi:hypothetical protein
MQLNALANATAVSPVICNVYIQRRSKSEELIMNILWAIICRNLALHTLHRSFRGLLLSLARMAVVRNDFCIMPPGGSFLC